MGGLCLFTHSAGGAAVAASGQGPSTLQLSPTPPPPPALSCKQKALCDSIKCLGTAWQATGLEVAGVQLVNLTCYQEVLNC